MAWHVDFSDIFQATSTTLDDFKKKRRASYYSIYYKPGDTYRQWTGGFLSPLPRMEILDCEKMPI
jgi:hypothetical protein